MRREIEFVKVNPTQNMTILVTTKHRAEEYAHIASKVMSYENVYAEQVGFIEQPVKPEAAAHLQMAGGEFCGNACMALAALIASEKGIAAGGVMNIELEASGSEQIVSCQVKKIKEGYICRMDMPVPRKIEQQTVRYEGEDLTIAIVRYHEFFHLVLEVDRFNKAVRKKAQRLAKLLGTTSGFSVIGVLLFRPAANELAPLIYVPSLDSMIWEKGCGSGTASLGAYMAWKNKGAIAVQINQPGGIIHVAADSSNNEITNLSIEGSVEIVAQGQAYLNI
ncbi:diaminopimelate epimerase [Paenibacillus jiagnxiensis]|uniref:diaminopimelate epimerase n=1 Tax=Paenibacillus jiagnxiensis TaxID=3228926 RepID=UPI0033A43E8D